MLRLLVIFLTATTVGLVVTAVFFLDGPFGRQNRVAMADMDRTSYAELDARWAALDKKAFLLFRRAKLDEAAGMWRGFVEQHPRHVQAQYRLGVCLATQGKLDEGRRHLLQAAELAPDDPRIRKELGICLLQMGRLDDARHQLQAVLRGETQFPEAHFYLGMICEKEGRLAEAKQQYIDEVNANPCNTFAWYKLQTWDDKHPGQAAAAGARPGPAWWAWSLAGGVVVCTLFVLLYRKFRVQPLRPGA